MYDGHVLCCNKGVPCEYRPKKKRAFETSDQHTHDYMIIPTISYPPYPLASHDTIIASWVRLLLKTTVVECECFRGWREKYRKRVRVVKTLYHDLNKLWLCRLASVWFKRRHRWNKPVGEIKYRWRGSNIYADCIIFTGMCCTLCSVALQNRRVALLGIRVHHYVIRSTRIWISIKNNI